MNTTELLEKAVSAGASDIFVVAGRPVSMRIHGDIRMEDNTRLLPDDTRRIIEQIYELAGHRDIGILEDTGDDDFSFAVPGLSRFRVSAFKQRGSLSVVIRIISFTLPDPATFGIPEKIIRFADFSKGMVLVTGPAGSGNPLPSRASSTISIKTMTSTSSHWRILWNSFTGTTGVS